jgi:hypothetical protein
MKKQISILAIVLLYAFSVVGVPITQHFCGGEFAPKSCSCAKSVKKSSCCKDKVVVKQLKSDQKSSVFEFQFTPTITAVLPNHYFTTTTLSSNHFEVCSASNRIKAPPLVKQKVGIYLFNCVFRI